VEAEYIGNAFHSLFTSLVKRPSNNNALLVSSAEVIEKAADLGRKGRSPPHDLRARSSQKLYRTEGRGRPEGHVGWLRNWAWLFEGDLNFLIIIAATCVHG
jgi:hypothetical protein